jgi:signal transduction histidine kinase/CheY-like chemotaxis protein
MTAAFADAVNTGKMLQFEHRMVSPDDVERWALSVIEPLRDEHGVHVGAIGVLKDITEQKLEQRALAAAREAAEASSAAKSEFLAMLSHEIRTPLNGVLGVAQALAKTPLSVQQKAMVELLVSAGQSLRQLVDDSLDIGRIEAGATVLASEPFEIAAVVRETATLYAASARDKDLTFEYRGLTGEGLHVRGDALRLRQVVANLVGNAIKFTSTGGVAVEFNAGPGEDGRVAVSVRVRDTGAGFDDAAKARIFDRYVQGQAPAQGEPRGEGAGLGLAIARTLARAMDGDIDCISQTSVGSTFTFVCRLPAAEAASMCVDDVTEFEDQDHVIIDILVAEDHAMNQKILSLLLEPVAARLTFVEDGLAACAAVERAQYDLALMDVQMPLLDGLSATRLIRAREAISGRPRTPIVCLTAQASQAKIKEAELAGVDGYVSKPINKEELFKAIESALGETGGGRFKAAV